MGKNTEAVVEEVVVEEAPKKKKRRVCKKDFDKNPGCLTLSIEGVDGEVIYNPADLPEDIQAKLPATCLGHKLGDATSGKAGQEAADSVAATWQAMMEGKWKQKKAAEPKITLSALSAGLENLDAAEAEAARTALAALGITL